MATVIATQTCRVAAESHRATVVKGKPYDSDDPVVKANRWLFADADEYAAGEHRPTNTADLGHRSMSARRRKATVEQATAAPGEQRQTRYYCEVDGCRSWATSEADLEAHVAEAHADG